MKKEMEKMQASAIWLDEVPGDDADAKAKCDVESICGDFEDPSTSEHGKKEISFHVPRIYYGSRTHRQIAQVTRELRKTAYCRKRMTILSSREHSCIQDTLVNKTTLCHDLLDPLKAKGCDYYNARSKISSFGSLGYHGLNNVWDIEELVDVGKTIGACPYFAARSLMEEADIIFCPYNYLIDPAIRESMSIDLKNEIVILDEAHNIEDICRDVASVNLRDDHLQDVAEDCKKVSQFVKENNSQMYVEIQSYILKLKKFISEQFLKSIDDFNDELSSTRWTGEQLAELFEISGLGGTVRADFLVFSAVAISDYNQMKEALKDRKSNKQEVKPVIAQSTKVLLERLIFGLNKISSPENAHDYRAFVVENTVTESKQQESVYGYVSTGQKKTTKRVRTLQLICMNPAVIFEPIAKSARSIILASGTLAPTSSFQSELGTKFPNMLNANHVVPKDQVYIRCIPHGPSGTTLRANYQNVNQLTFKDELGRIVLDVCETVPHGILCFFSSYNAMKQQTDRWKFTDAWNNIRCVKRVFMEPRISGHLADVMEEFRGVIRDTSDASDDGITGAILFAVFRGKVAEGIDFSDNEARCVMTVGIPFAMKQQPSIGLKCDFNDANRSKGLLPGSEWYVVQAFRALNQALGRCIRHRNDWGAVLLIDDRFLMKSNFYYLPKWVKSMWSDKTRYDIKEELEIFVERQKEKVREREELENVEIESN